MTMNWLSAPTEEQTHASLFSLVRSLLTGSRLASLPFSDDCELLVEHADQSNLGATSMLFWRAISEAKEGEAEELDLGPSAFDNQGRLLYRYIG